MAESHEITVYSAIICYNFQDGGNNIMISYVKPTISWSIFINKFFKILTHREVPYDIFINWKKQTKDIVNINQLQAYIDKNLYPPEEYDYEVKVYESTI